jgi:hypothetical protein
MRIIGLQDFLAMPDGTVFAKYQPQMFGELCIKGDSIHGANDFTFWPLWDIECGNSAEHYEQLVAAETQGADIPIDLRCEQRDGFFETGQLFAVFSKDEVRLMAESLRGVADGR